MMKATDLRQRYYQRKQERQTIKLSEKRNHKVTAPALTRASLQNTPTGLEPVSRIVPKDIAITIHYVDSLGNQLLDSVTVYGQYKARLSIPWQTIPSYILASIHHFQQVFLPNPDGIYLIYAKQTAAPVVIYHRSTNGRLITPPEFLRGNLNSAFKIKPLYNMQQFVESVQPSDQGTFTKNTEQVDITYETMQLSKLDVQPDTYVQLLTVSEAFSEPDRQHLLDFHLPQNSIWRVYQAVQEKTNQTIWLNLGGYLWVLAQNTRVVANYKNNLLDTPPTLKLRYNVLSDMPINRQAVITASVKRPITNWDFPYGNTLPDKLSAGQVIYVTNQIQLDNMSLWDELSDHTFLEAKYLKFME